MKTSTTAICLIACGMLMMQSPVLAAGGRGAGGGGGGFGDGGFHGGSVGNAGHVNNNPYYSSGYYGYATNMGATEFAGDQDLSAGDFGAGSTAPTAYAGTGGGPPEQLQDGQGVYAQDGQEVAGGPSWDHDWWANDPRGEAGGATDGSIGTAVASLPRGSYAVFAADSRYFYAQGTFYQATDSGYQTVAPPAGVEVKQIPEAAEMVKVDGQQYFVYNHIHYQALYGGSGIVYKVVEEPSS